MPKAKNVNKAPKDTNAPKRPPSAYFIFSNERRKELIQQQPNSRITELSKVISKEWKEMSDDTKVQFDEQAVKRKAEYKEKWAVYIKTNDYQKHLRAMEQWKEQQKQNKILFKTKSKNTKYKEPKKPKKPDNCPKRALSTYFLFSNQRRGELSKQYPSKKITELSKMISEEWKVMTDEVKKPFEIEHVKLKTQYDIDYAKYVVSNECAEFKVKSAEYVKQHKLWEAKVNNEGNESDSDGNDSDNSSFSSDSRSRSRGRSHSRSRGSDKENSRSVSMEKNGHSNTNSNSNKHKSSKHKHKSKGKSKNKSKSKHKSSKHGSNGSSSNHSAGDGPKMPQLKKPKKPSDPNAPKKPATGYFMFAKENRARLREENPGTKITEIAKMLGQLWGTTDATKKKDYSDQASAKKDEYNQRLEDYKQTEQYATFEKVLSDWKDEVERKVREHKDKCDKLQEDWDQKQRDKKRQSKHKSSKSSTRSPKRSRKDKKHGSKSGNSKNKSSKSGKSKNKSKSKHKSSRNYESGSDYSSRSRSRSRSVSSRRGKRRSRSNSRSASRSRSRSYSSRSGSYSSAGSYSSRSRSSRSRSRSASRSFTRSRSGSRSRSRSYSRSSSRSRSRSHSGSRSPSRSEGDR